jgi:hypothetical protein
MDLVFEMCFFFICAFLDRKKVDKVQKLSSLKLDVSSTFICGNTGLSDAYIKMLHIMAISLNVSGCLDGCVTSSNCTVCWL